MSWLEITLLVLAGAGAAFLLWRLVVAARFYLKLRGERLVTCPETQKPEAVKVAAAELAVRRFVGLPELRLEDCSRWPEREGCGQDCLREVEADPEACAVWKIVNTWYAGKKCAYCGKAFGEIHWHDHRPALLDPERRTVQWTQVAAEKLPEVFSTHWPVCWNCHVTESFRREHPELVTPRPRH